MAYKDPEKYKAYQRAYREANRDKARQYARDYRRRNPNYMKDWHAANPDHCRNWRADNPERARELWRIQASRRKALKAQAFVENVVPGVVYEMHGGVCGICKGYVEPSDFHVDHVIPLAKGGVHGYINTQPAHPLCNLRKGDRFE